MAKRPQKEDQSMKKTLMVAGIVAVVAVGCTQTRYQGGGYEVEEFPGATQWGGDFGTIDPATGPSQGGGQVTDPSNPRSPNASGIETQPDL
jgi:hypothetical protein